MALVHVLKEALARHRATVAVVGLFLVVLGGIDARAAYEHVDRVTTAHERTLWSEESAYTYAVPVTRNSTHYENGTVLPMGQPAYYRTVSDHVDLEYAWHPDRATSGQVDAEMVLRIDALSPGGKPYWSVQHALAAQVFDDPSAVALHARLDLDALASEVDRVTRELPPGEGGVKWTVTTTIAYALADAAGRSSFDFPIGWSDPRFMLPAPEEATATRAHTESQSVTVGSQAGWTGVLSALRAEVLLGIGGAAILLAAYLSAEARRLGPLDAAHERDLAKYREWVSPVAGRLDTSRFPSTVVDMATLGDLVEAASDARTRVLLDRERRVYYVVLPHATYRYAAARPA